jgi:hypothetical protein
VVERDAPASPLPDRGDVPQGSDLDPGSNDTIDPGVLVDGTRTLDGDGEVGDAGEDAVADRSARNRLPTGVLVALFGVVVLAAVGVGTWLVRRRDGAEPE